MSDIAEKNIFQMADLEPLVNVAMGSITTENGPMLLSDPIVILAENRNIVLSEIKSQEY